MAYKSKCFKSKIPCLKRENKEEIVKVGKAFFDALQRYHDKQGNHNILISLVCCWPKETSRMVHTIPKNLCIWFLISVKNGIKGKQRRQNEKVANCLLHVP